MSSRSREKIALVVFVGLMALGLLGLGSYIIAGHSWNVAASNLDDTFGSMDGYTAIVYAGTEPLEPVAAGGTGVAKAGEAGAAGKAEVPAGGSKAASEGADVPDADAAAPEPALPGATGAASPSPSETASVPSDADPSEAAPASSSADPSAPAVSSPSAAAPAKKAVTVEEAQASYEEKNATVFALDTEHLETYGEGTILKKGDHRFGVFSVPAKASSIAIEKQVAYFQRHEVDFIVALVPDKEFVEAAAEGIDIVISTQDEGLFVMGETIDGTFYVDAPHIGAVGAILISPSNVVSAKVIEEV